MTLAEPQKKAKKLLVYLVENAGSLETKKIFDSNKNKLTQIVKFAASLLDKDELQHCLQCLSGSEFNTLSQQWLLLKILSQETVNRFWPPIEKILAENFPEVAKRQIENYIRDLTKEEIRAIQAYIRRPAHIDHQTITFINQTLQKWLSLKEKNIFPKLKSDKNKVIF